MLDLSQQLRLDPNKPDSRDDSLALPQGLDPDRLHRRRHLLDQAAVPSPGDAFVDQQDAALAMLCNGKVASESAGREFSFAVAEPGNYRVEVWLKIAGEDTIWILSNPIYIRPGRE